MRLAVVDPHHAAPPVVRRLFAASPWCTCELVEASAWANVAHDQFAALLVVDESRDASDRELTTGVDTILQPASAQPPAVILTDQPAKYSNVQVGHVCLPFDSPVELVHGAILGLAAAQPSLRQADQDRLHMRRLTDSVHRHIESLDAELRLASRVQQHFVPRGVQRFGSAAFSTLYRPCSWVSGDLFDVFPLGDEHVGFYVADVVGHGVAAGLLTMYVKHAICPQRAGGGIGEIVRPSEVLACLNNQLAGDVLQECQFVTMWYGLLDLRSFQLECASAGHPPPLLVEARGNWRELYGEGCLLGLEADQLFQSRTVQLHRQDRILVYSDGLDEVLVSQRRSRPQAPALQPGMEELLRSPSAELLAGLERRLNDSPGSLNRADDVSVILLDIDVDKSN
jgi:serine phosphatase RsbU (regulator of sigma subunit)